MINNKVYDIIKFISLIIAPIGVLIASLATIWGWGEIGSKVVATISAVDVLVGAVVVILKGIYDKKKEVEDGKT